VHQPVAVRQIAAIQSQVRALRHAYARDHCLPLFAAWPHGGSKRTRDQNPRTKPGETNPNTSSVTIRMERARAFETRRTNEPRRPFLADTAGELVIEPEPLSLAPSSPGDPTCVIPGDPACVIPGDPASVIPGDPACIASNTGSSWWEVRSSIFRRGGGSLSTARPPRV
jgi:hypothetical protein